MEPITIRTARLTLRPLLASDIDDVFDYAADEAFGRYIPTVPHPYDTRTPKRSWTTPWLPTRSSVRFSPWSSTDG